MKPNRDQIDPTNYEPKAIKSLDQIDPTKSETKPTKSLRMEFSQNPRPQILAKDIPQFKEMNCIEEQ